uniref:Protein kinase domain-containing protein n=1 Tax=viral metagenome TaxID=1070528 RepID=A0A6C0E7Y5_9ZZZZ
MEIEKEIINVFGSSCSLKNYIGDENETKVYYAKYQNKDVLLKIISKKNIENFNNLLVEINFIRYLSKFTSSQKHIYRCINFKLTQDYLYLLLEKPNGQTLASFYKNLPEMDWNLYQKIITMIMFRLLLAINYIHKKGVAHRNINPETIHIIYNDSLIEDLRLSDFAVSCGKYIALPLQENNNQTDYYYKFCNTLDLGIANPPENDNLDVLAKKIKSLSKNQTRNSIYLYFAKKADVWALGVLFWKLLNCNSFNKNPLDLEFPVDYKKNKSWQTYNGHKNKLLEGVFDIVIKFMLSDIPERGKSNEILEKLAIHYKYNE